MNLYYKRYGKKTEINLIKEQKSEVILGMP